MSTLQNQWGKILLTLASKLTKIGRSDKNHAKTKKYSLAGWGLTPRDFLIAGVHRKKRNGWFLSGTRGHVMPDRNPSNPLSQRDFMYIKLTKQGQYTLRGVVGLSQHGSRGLHKNLRTSQVRRFGGEVGIADRGFSSLEIFICYPE